MLFKVKFSLKFCGDAVFAEYLQKNISDFSQVAVFCKEISEFIKSNVDVILCEEIETTMQFELNFIKKGIDKELDERNERYWSLTIN